jgi:hypothetical protein
MLSQDESISIILGGIKAARLNSDDLLERLGRYRTYLYRTTFTASADPSSYRSCDILHIELGLPTWRSSTWPLFSMWSPSIILRRSEILRNVRNMQLYQSPRNPVLSRLTTRLSCVGNQPISWYSGNTEDRSDRLSLP